MGDPRGVPRQPDYISLDNGICDDHSGMKFNDVVDNSIAKGLTVSEHEGSTTEDNTVIRQKTSLVSIPQQSRDVIENSQGNENKELSLVSISQKFNYRVKVQNQLDTAFRQLDLFRATSKSIADSAESFCRSALTSTQVVQKNFDALVADLAGNRELLLHSIEKKRKTVISKLERQSGDIAKVIHQLKRATEYAERALSEDALLGSRGSEVMETLAEAMSRPCECLFATPDPDDLHAVFDGDSLLILKSQIQRFGSIRGGVLDLSCKCKLTAPLRQAETSLPQPPAHRPSILLTPSRKRLNSEASRLKSANKVVRINTDKSDSQWDRKCEHESSGESYGHLTARKSTSGKRDVVLPKFRRFRPSPSPTATTPSAHVSSNVSSASNVAEKDNQDSSSQTESSRESSAETSANETSDVRPGPSPEKEHPKSSEFPVNMSTQATSPNPKFQPGRFTAPRFEPIPLRTRSSTVKQPSVRQRRHSSDQGKPVDVTLRRLNLDVVIPSRRRQASVFAASELQQTRLQHQVHLSSDDEDAEERQLAAVIALSAVEAQNPSRTTSELPIVSMDDARNSHKDGGTEMSSRTDTEAVLDIQPLPVSSEVPQQSISQSNSLEPRSLAELPQPPESKASVPEYSEQPRRLLARKSAGPTVKPEETDAEIKNIRELPIYHTCTDTYGTFYVDRYYKPMHPCVLCLKCGETLATFQFATHSHSNDPKRCLTKKWRHCIRLKHTDNNTHQLMFQLLKERFGHKNPRGSSTKKIPAEHSPSKDMKVKRKKRRRSSDSINYLSYPSIVETSEELTRFPRQIGQAYTGKPAGPRPVPGELVCVVPPVDEYDGQPWIGQLLRFTTEDETEAELKWLRGTYSQPWSFEKRQRFMTSRVPLESVAFYGFTLRPNGRLYTQTVECIRHELEETEESDQGREKL